MTHRSLSLILTVSLTPLESSYTCYCPRSDKAVGIGKKSFEIAGRLGDFLVFGLSAYLVINLIL